jgi:hypothetical protein
MRTKYIETTMVRITPTQKAELQKLRQSGYNSSSLIRLWIAEGLERLKQKRALTHLGGKDGI